MSKRRLYLRPEERAELLEQTRCTACGHLELFHAQRMVTTTAARSQAIKSYRLMESACMFCETECANDA